MISRETLRSALDRSVAASDAKVSKESVSYEHPAAKAAHCALCRHWEAPRACKVVKGVIRPEDWCERFRKA